MSMKKIIGGLAVVAAITAGGLAWAAEEEGHNAAEPTHFPIMKPEPQDWSFSGPFGVYDKGQLQRGLKVYKDVCANCHGMHLVAFRAMEGDHGGLGYSDGQIKTFAAQFEIADGVDESGEPKMRPRVPSDYFPTPVYSGIGTPPDLSLMAKARAVERGFPTFIFDIFTQYAEGGPDYIHALLTGYDHTPPAGMEIAEGTYYNPYFVSGKSLAMAKPLNDGDVTYDDGAPATVDQYAKDVSAFLMWAAEPHLEDRKSTGFRVMVFLLLFAGLVYLTKRKIWSGVAH